MLKCNYKNLNAMLSELGVVTEKTKHGIAFTFYINGEQTLENKRCCYYVIKTGELVLQNVFGENKVVNYTHDLNTIKTIINDVRRNG